LEELIVKPEASSSPFSPNTASSNPNNTPLLQQAQNLLVHPNNYFDSDGNTKKEVSPLIMSEEEYEAKLG